MAYTLPHVFQAPLQQPRPVLPQPGRCDQPHTTRGKAIVPHATAASSLPPPSPTTTTATIAGPGRAVETRTSGGTSTSGMASPESIADFLRSELPRIFTQGRLTEARYARDFRFEDPVSRMASFRGFQTNLGLLRTIFNIAFDVHKVEATSDSQVTSWWTMDLQPKVGLRRPHIIVTGRSLYGWDVLDGKLNFQKDVWDSLQDNQYLSAEAVVYIIRSLLNLQTTPGLETPKYTVLKKAAEYEVRRYEGYMVAETSMPADSKPAAGTGFQEIASYIFSGNDRGTSMEMTTPVISTGGQSSPTMQFVMERKYGEKGERLPEPRDSRITKKEEASATVAAISFSGLPLDFEVTEAERKLRAALLLDGLKPQAGYKLARYNDPFTLPPFRRNEVIMQLEGFEL